MRKIFPAHILFLLAAFFPLAAQDLEGPSPAAGRFRDGPIDVNLIIDGSRYPGEGRARDWVRGHLLEGILQEGDYLRIWIAGDKAAVLYQGAMEADAWETVGELIRRPLPGSPSADFAGALRAAREAGRSENAILSYTLLVSSPGGLSPAHTPYLRYSRVMEFPGWRALVVALDIGEDVREAADSFLSDGSSGE
jgi:hypothetical protein